MSQVLVNESSLSGIAGAIRSKNGTNTTYKPSQMAAAIQALPGAPTLQSLSVNANGSYTPGTGVDGYSSVSVDVPNSYGQADEGKVVSNGALVAQTARSGAITQNGTYDTTTNNEVTVNVAGGGGDATILSGSIEPTAAQGSDGNLYLETSDIPQPFVTNQSELIVTVTANSNWGGYEPWKAFTENSGWIGAGGNPHYLQIEFPAPTMVKALNFKTGDSARSHSVSRIAYSNDGSTFTDLTLITSTMVSNVGHVEIGNPVSAQYYRLIFDGNYGASTYPMVGALKLIGDGDTILAVYLKVNGTWQDLIGSDINDVGGVS